MKMEFDLQGAVRLLSAAIFFLAIASAVPASSRPGSGLWNLRGGLIIAAIATSGLLFFAGVR